MPPAPWVLSAGRTCRARGAAKAAIAVAISVWPVLPRAETAVRPAPGAATAAVARDPLRWPFTTDSPWNLPLRRADRLEPPGAACTRALRWSGGSDINAAEWSHPIYAARPTDAPAAIYVRGERVASVRIPRTAAPAGPATEGTDAHLHVVDEDRRHVHELWHARWRPDGALEAEGYTRNDLYGPGVGSGGERAYGGSAIGGLIRTGELRNGIRHALALALPRRLQRRGPVWPATAEDRGAAGTYRGAVPLGQRVALPRDVDLAKLGLGPEGLLLARALQDYGALDVDSAGDVSLYAEPAAEGELGTARQDWVKLRKLLRCVARPPGAAARTRPAATVAGAGADTDADAYWAPLAPPLGEAAP